MSATIANDPGPSRIWTRGQGTDPMKVIRDFVALVLIFVGVCGFVISFWIMITKDVFPMDGQLLWGLLLFAASFGFALIPWIAALLLLRIGDGEKD